MNPGQLGRKEQQIMDFLHHRNFDPILQSPVSSEKLSRGVRYTIMRMERREAAGMIQYIGVAAVMRQEGFDRFDEELEQFRVRFDDRFLREP